MADVAKTATQGVKSTFGFVGKLIKPASLSLVFMSAVAVFDGGLSAATLNAVNSGSAAGLLSVPTEGLSEVAGTISEGASWLAGTTAPA